MNNYTEECPQPTSACVSAYSPPNTCICLCTFLILKSNFTESKFQKMLLFIKLNYHLTIQFPTSAHFKYTYYPYLNRSCIFAMSMI